MAGVLVFGDAPKGALAATSLEVATAGRMVAEALGESLLGGLIGAGIGGAAQDFLSGGMAELYVADDECHEPYSSDVFVASAEAIVGACSPSVILFPHTIDTREWVPRLAARLGGGLTTDCARLTVEDGLIVMTKPIYGGSVLAEYVATAQPAMATIRAGAFEAATVEPAGRVVDVDTPATQSRVTVLEEIADVIAHGPRLKDAKVVVSGGLGVGGPENWGLIEETAAAVDGAVGATRAVTDLGWVPSSHQVGLTGTSVAPDLYIAIGVSGAIQHMAGITRAKTVVAINRDPEASIFSVARFGAVGDAREIVPAFVERVKQLRSG